MISLFKDNLIYILFSLPSKDYDIAIFHSLST